MKNKLNQNYHLLKNLALERRSNQEMYTFTLKFAEGLHKQQLNEMQQSTTELDNAKTLEYQFKNSGYGKLLLADTMAHLKKDSRPTTTSFIDG